MNDPTTFAAPAPLDDAPGLDLDDLDERPEVSDDHLDELCERLVHWCRTRRFYGRQRLPPSILGRLGKRTRPLRPPPDAACNAELAALYLAMLGQPADALDRQVFELHYFGQIRFVKTAAEALGVSRQHWYRLLRGFRRRIYAASREILARNDGILTNVEATP